MARGRPAKSEVSSEELKTQLLNVARGHFSKHGYQGASLKDICEDAGVANSLINYHFKGKEGLFKACMEKFAVEKVEAINRLLAEVRTSEEMRIRLELFVNEMMMSMLKDPHSFEILEREMRAGNPLIVKIYQETLLLAFKNVVAFFKKAQDNKLIKADLDPFVVAALLFTSTCDSARKDFLAKRFFNLSFTDAKWRSNFGKHIVELFMNGVMR